MANVAGTTQMSSSKPTEVWALTTDGTNLFAGGNFSSVNGTAVQPLVKLDPVTGAVLPFNTGAIPDIGCALKYYSGNVYAGACAYHGDSMTVYPWIAETIEVRGTLLQSGASHTIDTLTIYP